MHDRPWYYAEELGSLRRAFARDPVGAAVPLATLLNQAAIAMWPDHGAEDYLAEACAVARRAREYEGADRGHDRLLITLLVNQAQALAFHGPDGAESVVRGIAAAREAVDVAADLIARPDEPRDLFVGALLTGATTSWLAGLEDDAHAALRRARRVADRGGVASRWVARVDQVARYLRPVQVVRDPAEAVDSAPPTWIWVE